jgi:hypothetical protein
MGFYVRGARGQREAGKHDGVEGIERNHDHRGQETREDLAASQFFRHHFVISPVILLEVFHPSLQRCMDGFIKRASQRSLRRSFVDSFYGRRCGCL